MTNKDKVLKVVMGVLFPVTAALFFLTEYPAHLKFQEMTQLFEAGWSYFADVSSIPGGVADYLGRFLTQFFIYPAAGAIIIALLLLLLQRCLWAVMQGRDMLSYLLSFIPFMLAWIFLCNENATMGAVVALIIVLAAACFVMKTGKNTIIQLIAMPALYWICGPVAIIFVIVGFRQKKPLTALAALALTFLFACASEYLCEMPLQRLLTGVHYIKYRNVFPLWIWVGTFFCFVLAFIPESPNVRRVFVYICAVIIYASIALPFSSADHSRENTMRYAVLATEQRWDDIVSQAKESAPRSYVAIRCLNLALGKKGLLPQRMFNYVQEGPDCLVSDVSMDFVSDIVSAQVYWELALIGPAQHLTFDAQENLPDFQKSSACYRMLARTAAANGQSELAARYLKALGRTMFHKRWAEEFSYDHEIEQKRAEQISGDSYFFVYEKVASILGLLYTQHNENRLALDYLLAYSLLIKDLDAFTAFLPMAGYECLPKNWQEAWMLDLLLSNGSLEGLPQEIAKDNAARLDSFMKGYMNYSSTDFMLKNFADTYWFYHFYRYNND